MQAALLYQLTGEPDKDSIESRLNGDFPAVDAEATQYLDGKTLYHGEAADYVTDEVRVPDPREEEIVTVTDERNRRVSTEWIVDLDDQWAGISTGDGEFFLNGLIASHGLLAEKLEIALDAWSEQFADAEDASLWGLSYSQSIEDGDDADRAGAAFHEDASIADIPPTGVSALGFFYRWGGTWAEGIIAQSGYVAIYRDWTVEEFGRWLADEVLPYAVYDTDAVEQQTLPGGECAECGRETDNLAEFGGRDLCPACLDAAEERGTAATDGGGR